MAKKIVLEFLVKGGEVTPGPPVGPTLGQNQLPVGKVVADINKATSKWKGLLVPVKVIVDPATREYEIEVGTPTTSALIMKEAKISKGSGQAGKEFVADLSLEKIIEIAKLKQEQMYSRDLKSAIKQVIGTMVSMGVTVEGIPPKEAQAKLDELLAQKNIKL